MKSLTTDLIIAELQKRNYKCTTIPTTEGADYVVFTNEQGERRYMRGATTDKSNVVAYRIAADKFLTGQIADKVGVPIPKTALYTSDDEATAFLAENSRIVVKPLDASHGNGVTVDVVAVDKMMAAIERAKGFSDSVVLQQQVSGRDLRLLYIDGKLCAAACRRPATVRGDGQRTLKELIEMNNALPDRGVNYQKKYNVIPLEVAELYLGERFTSYVPKPNEEVQVVGTANIGTGGSAQDVTDDLPAEIIEHGARLVKELRVEVCGVDFLEGPDGYFLIEINASPNFSLHHFPHEGKPRDVAATFVDWLLTQN